MDRTLDRLVEFDERSRAYPIRALVADKPLRSYTWRCDAKLDQGREGACVGFGWAHELAARPKARTVTDDTARTLYRRAQQLDQWPGESYEGTSVLAGAKAVQEQKWLGEYRWAFGLRDTLLAIGYRGPVVIGVNWYAGMFAADSDGYIHATGERLGGHCVILRGVNVRRGTVTVHNSWGRDWGYNGCAYLSHDDLERLLSEDGEACVPVRRL